MYNLIVGYTKGTVDAGRVLEYTDPGARVEVAPNDQMDFEEVVKLPTLIMPETGDTDARQVAKIGRLTRLSRSAGDYKYGFTADNELSSDLIVAAASALGIDDFEFVRHHWAIKSADLHAVLLEHLAPSGQLAEEDLDRVSQLLLLFEERDVDAFLLAVGASATKSQWADRPRAVRRLEVKELLRPLTPTQLQSLETALEDELAEMAWQSGASPVPASVGADDAHAEPDVQSTPDVSPATRPTVDSSGPIFVVHGHDRANLHLAVRVLENSTGREVVVLHERPNKGRTILEKFEQHATSAAFAVVLLTADDEGAISGSASPQKRGRQNVIFEMGFFFAHLGRDRVVVLVDDGVEKPSDISGLVYIALDPAGAWKQELGRELHAASIPVDYSRMP